MIIIVAVDNNGGMMFNNRRQSQDRVLRQKVVDMTAGSKLWMNKYSYKQFAKESAPQINVDDNFLQEAASGEFCFVENVPVAPYERWIEKVVLVKWNRDYPADMYFDLDLSGWHTESYSEFAGSSHEKITMEVDVR